MTDPAKPRLTGLLPSIGALDRATAVGDFLYVTAGFAHRLHLLDARKPEQTQGSITHLTDQGIDGFAAANDRGLLLASDRLLVLDVSAPMTPTLVAAIPVAGVRTLFVLPDAAYVGDDAGNLALIDLTDAAHPHFVAACKLENRVAALTMHNGYAYLLVEGVGLAVMRGDADGRLAHIATLPITTPMHTMVAAQGYLLLAAGEAGLLVVDVNEPDSPRIVARYDDNLDARDVVLERGVAFVAAGEGGLRLFDMVDPLRPRPIGGVPTPDYAGQVISARGRVYLVDGYGGLWIFGVAEG